MSEPVTRAPLSRSAVPFTVISGISIVTGGVISAASAFSPSYAASWAVAYFVLVAGVAQLALGLGQASLAVKQPSVRLITVEVLAFNIANMAVLTGTLLALKVLVYLGCGVFIAALGLFIWGTRAAHAHHKWMLYGFRTVLGILIISTPIGLIIAELRAS
ncbi:MAG: hypothetical protein KF867_03590 [Cryobacterium sp.]|nr:hypothetical protein [Cryobacterium sp.]